MNFPAKRKFIGIHFKCCNIYSRIYINKEGTEYRGACPSCFRKVSIKIGESGSDSRFFSAS